MLLMHIYWLTSLCDIVSFTCNVFGSPRTPTIRRIKIHRIFIIPFRLPKGNCTLVLTKQYLKFRKRTKKTILLRKESEEACQTLYPSLWIVWGTQFESIYTHNKNVFYIFSVLRSYSLTRQCHWTDEASQERFQKEELAHYEPQPCLKSPSIPMDQHKWKKRFLSLAHRQNFGAALPTQCSKYNANGFRLWCHPDSRLAIGSHRLNIIVLTSQRLCIGIVFVRGAVRIWYHNRFQMKATVAQVPRNNQQRVGRTNPINNLHKDLYVTRKFGWCTAEDFSRRKRFDLRHSDSVVSC